MPGIQFTRKSGGFIFANVSNLLAVSSAYFDSVWVVSIVGVAYELNPLPLAAAGDYCLPMGGCDEFLIGEKMSRRSDERAFEAELMPAPPPTAREV